MKFKFHVNFKGTYLFMFYILYIIHNRPSLITRIHYNDHNDHLMITK